MSAGLEDQIRSIADAAFEQTTAVEVEGLASESGGSGVDRRWVAVAAAALTALLVGALVWADDAGEQIVPVDTVVPTSTDSPAQTTVDPVDSAVEVEGFSTDFSARSMLQEIPLRGGDSPVALRVSGVDLALISEVAGVERTGADDTSEPRSEWFEALFLDEAFTLPYAYRVSLLLTEPTVSDELGFDFLDIDRFVSMNPYQFGDDDDGYRGEVDTFVLRSDMSDLVATAGDDSIIDLGAGADSERDMEQRTGLRPTGRPLRLGIDAQDSMVSVAFSTSTIESWLDGADETLADVDDLFAAAATLDLDDQLYAAELDISGRDVSDPDNEIYDQGWTADDILVREEFSTFGWGSSGVADTQRTTIVYVFADDAAAAASVEPIATLYAPDAKLDGRPDETMADLFLLDAVDAVGRTVVVSGKMGPSGANDFASIFAWGPRTVHR